MNPFCAVHTHLVRLTLWNKYWMWWDNILPLGSEELCCRAQQNVVIIFLLTKAVGDPDACGLRVAARQTGTADVRSGL